MVYPWIYRYPRDIDQDGIYMEYTWNIPGIYMKLGFQMYPSWGCHGMRAYTPIENLHHIMSHTGRAVGVYACIHPH
jgi:hypothetical protein